MGKMTSFPHGFANGVTIRNLPILQTNPGQVFFVNNSGVLPDNCYGASDYNKGTYTAPMSTIAGALAQCVADRGDIIFLMPGHAETVSAASGLTISKAGVTIVGLGFGTKRAKITLGTANTATIAVTADNVAIKNVLLVPNFLDIATCFALTTAANFTLDTCEFSYGTSLDFVSCVSTNTTSNNADGLTIMGCIWRDVATSNTSMVLMNGTNDRVTFDSNYVNLGVNNNKACLVNIANGKIITNLYMVNNRVYRLNTDTATGGILLHTNGSTNSGIVAGNFAQHADTAAELLITASSGLGVFNNYASGVAGASGYLLPAADS